jgi:hypothetical protein
MLEPCKDLPFLTKSLQNLIGIHAAAYELESHHLLELSVRPLGEENSTHPTATQFPDNLVGADPAALHWLLEPARGLGDQVGQQAFLRSICIEQLADVVVESLIAAALSLEKRLPLRRRLLSRGVKELADLTPAFLVHPASKEFVTTQHAQDAGDTAGHLLRVLQLTGAESHVRD